MTTAVSHEESAAAFAACNPKIIQETRQYIRDFDRLHKETTTAPELYNLMLKLDPDLMNPGSPWWAAAVAKGKS